MQKEQLIGIIGKELSIHLERNGLLAAEEERGAEQKGRGKPSRKMKDQLLVDKTILENCRRRLTNLSTTWIEYRKAYNMVPHS